MFTCDPHFGEHLGHHVGLHPEALDSRVIGYPALPFRRHDLGVVDASNAAGTVAYLEGQPAWSPDGPIPALRRPYSGWVDRAPVEPFDKLPLEEALRWAEANAESTYLRISLGGGEWFCVRGEAASGARHLDLDEIPELVDAEDQEPSGWSRYEDRKRHGEGAWLADVRQQLDLTDEEVALRAGVSVDSIRAFEAAPETSPITSVELVKVAHVLGGLPVPEAPSFDRSHQIAAEGPLQIAIQVLSESHPEVRLPPSPAFGSTQPRGELLKAVLARFAPVVRSHGFRGRGKDFVSEPETGTTNHVGLQPHKSVPPSVWERKGWLRRELGNSFFVNASVGYDFPDNPERGSERMPFSPAFRFSSPFTRLEARPPIGSGQEWLLDDPERTGEELVARFESTLLPWFAARQIGPVLAAMERPMWFEILDDRLTAVRLACLHGNRALGERLYEWAKLDRRQRHGSDPRVLEWLSSQYGLR